MAGKSGKKLERITVKEKIRTERVPVLFIYIQDGEIRSEFNPIDASSMNPYLVYGYMKLLIKDLEERLLYGEDD